MGYQANLVLRASAEETSATTRTGASQIFREAFGHGVAVLDVTDIADAAEADAKLNVYIDATPDSNEDVPLDSDKTWINIGRFAEVAGTTGTPATGTLTLTGAIVPGKHAESVLTSNGTAPADGATVTIGATVYTAKTTLTGAAFEVLIGNTADASEFLDNLKSAINASAGAGTTYGTGTTAHPTVVATTNTNTTQKVVARVPGTAANATATTETSATLSWEDTTLGGATGLSVAGVAPPTITVGSIVYSIVNVLSETNGAAAIPYQVLFGADSAAALDNWKSAVNASAGAGTTYSTGTVAHTQVTATTNTDTTQVLQAVGNSTSYNSVATTETIGNGAFGAATLTGGTPGVGSDVRQVLVFDQNTIESSQPVTGLLSDLGSAGVRKIGLLKGVRYRGVTEGSNIGFTYSVKMLVSP